MKRQHTEEYLQMALCNHLRVRAKPGVVWWHTPNGGKRGGREAGRFKRMGVLPGVSDLIFVARGKVFCLELKAPRGRASEAQLIFQSAVNSAGGYTSIAHGVDEALKALELWGLIRPDAQGVGRGLL
jgi:hypothetical protein